MLIGITDWRTLDVPDPVSFAVGKIAASEMAGAMGRMSRAMAGLGTGRLHLALRPDARFLFAWRATGSCRPPSHAVHKRFHTPHRGTIIIGVIAALLAALFPLRRAGRSGLHRHAAGLHRGVRWAS